MTREEVAHAKALIVAAIHEHMPSAAVASGWASAVDFSKWVAAMCERFPLESRPENLGITPLLEWLKERGIDCGRKAGLELRKRWLTDAMRDWCQKNPAK